MYVTFFKAITTIKVLAEKAEILNDITKILDLDVDVDVDVDVKEINNLTSD